MQKLICFVMLALMAVALLTGQDSRGGRGITLEESYLQESIDIMLIREQSRSESREVKESALGTIEAALQRGTRSEEIRIALETMGLEGIVNRTMKDGVIANNFPDIRSKTARCLGIMGGTQAYTILIRMLGAETQAFVLADVVNALMVVGLNPNNETVKLITGRVKHFDVTLPDDLLAFAALRAYESFASQNDWRLDTDTEALLVSISNGRYHTTARAYARDLLAKLRSYHG
ncbi:MAG: HEAT repeat domain-containing protein [Treponema sp.]|nr:HEAT repeat domain-containing protein [Treponema sp.]